MHVDASTDPYLEADIAGTARELVALASFVRTGAGQLAVAVRDPDPYAHSLAFIEVGTVSDPRAMVTVDIGASVLRIAGSPRSLERIAANVARLANAEPIASPVRQHVHIDWYPDHPFLADGTVSLVISLDPW